MVWEKDKNNNLEKGTSLNIILQDILKNKLNLQCEETYHINKKMSALLSGLGQYGKNQLIYNKDFGFHLSISTFFIFNPIINLPVRPKPKYSYMDLCNNCDLCIKNCPAQAIHGNDFPGWLDLQSCRKFFCFGNHPTICSTKYGINSFLNHKFSETQLAEINDEETFKKIFGFTNKECVVKLNNKFYVLEIKYCRECMNQIPCRKIEYEYDKNFYKIQQIRDDNPWE